MDLEIKENTSIKYQDNGNKIFAFVFPLQKKVRKWPCVFQIVAERFFSLSVLQLELGH